MNALFITAYTVANQFADFGNGKGNQIGVRDNKLNELGLGFATQIVANQFADFRNGKGNQIGVRDGFGLNQTNFTSSVAADDRMKSGMADVVRRRFSSTKNTLQQKQLLWRTDGVWRFARSE
ncbi:hypothetical protein RYX36_013627 [Vicia faba]